MAVRLDQVVRLANTAFVSVRRGSIGSVGLTELGFEEVSYRQYSLGLVNCVGVQLGSGTMQADLVASRLGSIWFFRFFVRSEWFKTC